MLISYTVQTIGYDFCIHVMLLVNNRLAKRHTNLRTVNRILRLTNSYLEGMFISNTAFFKSTKSYDTTPDLFHYIPEWTP